MANERVVLELFARDLASGEVRKFSANLSGAERATGALSAGTVALGVAVGNLASDALARATQAMGGLVSGAVDFQKQMLNVQSIANVDEEAFGRMTNAVIDLSTELPQSANTLAGGLYDIQSSGFAGEQGIKVLQAAAKAASAGLTDTSVSAAGLTAVLNAYGLGADDAAHISDVMFQTVNRGVITFEELSSQIGKTTAVASPLGVSFEEVGAALSVLTRHGIDAENATTQLNAIMTSLLQPSQQASELASDLGLQWDAGALRAKGLAGVMDDLLRATKGNQTEMATLLGDARSIRGAFVLASQGGKEFADELAAFQDVAGATDDVLSVQKQGLGFQLGILGNQIGAAGDRILLRLMPAITKVVEGITGWLQQNEDLVGSIGDVLVGALDVAIGAMGTFGDAITIAAKALDFLKPGIIAVALAITISMIPSLLALMPIAVLVGATIVASFAPIIATIAGITLAIAGVSAAINFFAIDFGDMGARLHDIADETGASYDDVKDKIRQVMDETGASFEEAADVVERRLQGLPDAIPQEELSARAKAAAAMAANGLTGSLAGGIMEGTPEVAEAAEGMTDEVKKALEEAHKAAIDEAKGLMSDLTGIFKSRKDLDAALKELHESITHPWADTKRRSAIEAALASKDVAAGLRSSDSRVRAQTLTFVNDLLNQYNTMAPGALAAGELVNPKLTQGLQANMALVLSAGQEIAGRAGDSIDFSTEAGALGYEAIGAMAQGMADHQATVLARANTIKAVATAALKAAAAAARESGEELVNMFAGGMFANRHKVEIAGLSVAEAAARYTRLRSPAEAGPLSEPANLWGERLDEMLGDGMLSGIPGIEQKAMKVAAAVASVQGNLGPMVAPTAGLTAGGITAGPMASAFGAAPAAGAGGPLVQVNIEHFHGTQENIDALSRALGQQVRLAVPRATVVPGR